MDDSVLYANKGINKLNTLRHNPNHGRNATVNTEAATQGGKNIVGILYVIEVSDNESWSQKVIGFVSCRIIESLDGRHIKIEAHKKKVRQPPRKETFTKQIGKLKAKTNRFPKKISSILKI